MACANPLPLWVLAWCGSSGVVCSSSIDYLWVCAPATLHQVGKDCRTGGRDGEPLMEEENKEEEEGGGEERGEEEERDKVENDHYLQVEAHLSFGHHQPCHLKPF